MEYIKLPWSTLNYPRILWNTLEYLELPWSTLNYFRVPWNTHKYCGIPWSTLEYLRVHWLTRKYCWEPWCILNYLGVPWSTLEYRSHIPQREVDDAHRAWMAGPQTDRRPSLWPAIEFMELDITRCLRLHWHSAIKLVLSIKHRHIV